MTAYTVGAYAAALAYGAVASAQSALVRVVADSTSVAPGSSTTVSVVVDYNTGGAGAGVFGPAGLYGFGGAVVASGAGAGDASGSSVVVSGFLPLGRVADAQTTDVATIAGGRLLADGGLVGTSQTVARFVLDIAGTAMDGSSVTIDYAGSVILSLDDRLASYATSPGVNQQALTTVPLDLTIGGRRCADVNGDDNVNSSDFFAWVSAFSSSDVIPCDVNNDRRCEAADFFAWVNYFGNPAADPGDCRPRS